MLKVNGPDNLLAYSGKEVDAVYLGGTANYGASSELDVLRARRREAIQSDPVIAGLTKDIQITEGKTVYMQTCFVCHQVNGEGIPNQIPPLAQADYLMEDKERSIRIVLQGLTGEIVVNNKKYNGVMLPLNNLSDEEIANVLTYVRNSFGNEGEAITSSEVRRVRSELPTTPTTPEVSTFE